MSVILLQFVFDLSDTEVTPSSSLSLFLPLLIFYKIKPEIILDLKQWEQEEILAQCSISILTPLGAAHADLNDS